MVNSSYINRLITGHGSFIEAAKTAERYYANKNDIKNTGAANLYMDKQTAEANPLRTADNRISHNWHSLLVNQKCSYLFTYPPTFDVGDKSANQIITNTLGDDFPKVSNKLQENFVLTWHSTENLKHSHNLHQIWMQLQKNNY